MILHGIRTLLLLQPPITLALPSQFVNRVSVPAVFCDHAVQGMSPPYAVITDTAQDPMLTLGEAVFGMRSVDLDIDVWAYNETAARKAMKTIREFFDDYSGPAGDYTIDAVIWQNEGYQFFRPTEGRDTRFHVATTSYQVQFS